MDDRTRCPHEVRFGRYVYTEGRGQFDLVCERCEKTIDTWHVDIEPSPEIKDLIEFYEATGNNPLVEEVILD